MSELTNLEDYLKRNADGAEDNERFIEHDGEKYMWKATAAAAIDTSAKNLERKAQAGKLKQVSKSTKTFYLIDDLLKVEKEIIAQKTGVVSKPSIVSESKTDRQTESLIPPGMNPNDFISALLQGIDTVVSNRIQAALPPAPEETKKHKKEINVSAIKDKQTKSFREAVAYTGLSDEIIKEGIASGEIQAKKTSEKGVWKIYSPSLDTFLNNYFAPKKKAANRK